LIGRAPGLHSETAPLPVTEQDVKLSPVIVAWEPPSIARVPSVVLKNEGLSHPESRTEVASTVCSAFVSEARRSMNGACPADEQLRPHMKLISVVCVER
jgi:hypothetical protein